MEFAHKLTSTRKGSLLLGVLAALIAGVLVVVYVNRYRNSVRIQGVPVTVLVASAAIPKGMPGQTVAANSLYTVTTIRQSQLLNGAISDPSSLVGTAAAKDIYRGEQLTTADFAASATSLQSSLPAGQRAISIPLDPAHGMIGEVQAGDHVDIYAGFSVQSVSALRLIMQDIKVLSINGVKGGLSSSGSSTLILSVTPSQAGVLAYASDNGRIWVTLRPSNGASTTAPQSLVTAQAILAGGK